MKKAPLTFALALGASFGLFALAQTGYRSSYTGPRVEITFWNGQSGDNRKYIDELVKRYNASHPNVSVRVTTPPGDTIAQQLPALVAGAARPT